MSTTKEMNKMAQEIAKHWFEVRQERVTPAIFSRTIIQARKLMECGFSEEEIISSIDYLNENPPPKGLTSLGYLNYVINETLEKIKFKEIKKEEKIVSSGMLKKNLNNVINNSTSEFQNRFF